MPKRGLPETLIGLAEVIPMSLFLLDENGVIIYANSSGASLVDTDLLNKVSRGLKKRQLTIATAESCSGGLLAHTLTNVSGSSSYFERGIVSYSNQAKIELLDVSVEIIREHGAVSEETARSMALGVKKCAHVDIGLSTTGIAGPTGGSKEKPVGLVYIGLAINRRVVVRKFLFKGGRRMIRRSACEQALLLLLEVLHET